MSVSRVCYITREEVMDNLEQSESRRSVRLIDRAIASASDVIDGRLRRKFYPEIATRYFSRGWQGDDSSWKLWLDGNELISAEELTSGGDIITDYFLEPQAYGPPYTHVEVNRSFVGSFTAGDTEQRDISIRGLYGYQNAEQPAGSLTLTANSSVTAFQVSDGSAVGVGDLLRIESERVLVTEKTALDTGQTMNAGLSAAKSDVTVQADTGSAFAIGEFLMIDSELMEITGIGGNNLTVARAVQGSVLAAHLSGASIYALRALVVRRAFLGTSAAAHTAPVALNVHRAPSLVREYALALATTYLEQGRSAYARTVGSGDNEREAVGRGVAQVGEEAATAHGRRGRIRSA